MVVGSSEFRRARRTVASAIRPVVDALESRRLLTSAVDGSNVLIVDATAGDDVISFAVDAADLVVTLNGAEDGRFDLATLAGVQVNAGDGNDDVTLLGLSLPATIIGGDGNDTLVGGSGADTIDGGLGNDSITGSDGANLLTGGVGNDTLTGGAVGDTIDGGAGNDSIVGGEGADSLTGGDDDDTLAGTDGDDTLLGGAGADSLLGGNGVDSIAGGDGADTLIGGLGADTLNGDAGDDSFITNDAEPDTLDGGAGNDSAVADNTLDSFTSIESGIPVPAPVVGVTTGGNPVADGSTAAIDFGTVNLGQTGPTRTFTVTNTGDATLSLGALQLPAGYAIVDDLVASLAPGASDTFTIRLTTTGSGTFAGEITFANTDPARNPFNFAVVGTVLVPTAPVIVVTQARPAGNIDNGNSTVEFGNTVVNATGPTRTFRVRNDGDAPLVMGTVIAPAGFKIIDPLKSTLAPGESESFVVQVDTSAPGGKDGFVTFTSNDPIRGNFSFRVQASVGVQAVPRPEVTLKSVQAKGNLRGVQDGSSAFAFGSVERGSTRPTRTFRVANDGDATLTLGAISVPAGFVILDNVAPSLASGAVDFLVIGMDTAAVGARSGNVAFTTNDADENPFTFAVSGTVVQTPPGAGPTATATLAGGVLTVNGTSGIDTIQVGQSSRGVSIVANSRTLSGSPFKGVGRIVVNAGDGPDRVILGPGVTIPSSLLGGNGDDTLVGGDGPDTILGAAGNDSLDGGNGADQLFGGLNNDTLTGGFGVDQLRGEDGNDVLFGADGLSELLDGGNGSDVLHKDRTDTAVNA